MLQTETGAEQDGLTLWTRTGQDRTALWDSASLQGPAPHSDFVTVHWGVSLSSNVSSTRAVHAALEAGALPSPVSRQLCRVHMCLCVIPFLESGLWWLSPESRSLMSSGEAPGFFCNVQGPEPILHSI